jgi:hypothetical protein
MSPQQLVQMARWNMGMIFITHSFLCSIAMRFCIQPLILQMKQELQRNNSRYDDTDLSDSYVPPLKSKKTWNENWRTSNYILKVILLKTRRNGAVATQSTAPTAMDLTNTGIASSNPFRCKNWSQMFFWVECDCIKRPGDRRIQAVLTKPCIQFQNQFWNEIGLQH